MANATKPKNHRGERCRMLGRISDADWRRWKEAAAAARLSFTEFARKAIEAAIAREGK